MKKFIVVLLLFGFVSAAVADIHAPPKTEYTPVRKLSRGLANLLYGWTELPSSVLRSYESSDQASEMFFFGIINGLDRTGARMAYGVYEIVNFIRPIYKDSYRPPYTDVNYDMISGFEEFPPQIGNLSTVRYTRATSF